MKKLVLIIGIALFITGCNSNKTRDTSTVINTTLESSHLSTPEIQKSLAKNNTQIATTEIKIDGCYVMDRKDNRILIVSTEKQDFSSTGGVKEYYDATWVSNVPSDIEIGQKVQFEIDGVTLTTYPGQAKAKDVSVITIQKPETSNLSVEEALKRTLMSDKVDRNKVLVIKSIKYFKQSDDWQIDLKEALGDKDVSISINDK
ncbi:DUF3221 domain-containing protein [Pseudobacteroides cellulosolvens]|uniref:Uncharacterized protein n=1 Tax=Pseudobacteroides cellulosolvens ATCC 35603 = DSM 2933 TaxID=398512 RepID=A0A0L6JP19_9FIRM|nr:DUF3221 domain-containing protein [Pseudobacteroides cellulosolvens]KNY27586.1 hypothetical protein Bccel_2857 [Pseudobacteroides cellulosolvens ATCC 35603 = DSM 2933]